MPELKPLSARSAILSLMLGWPRGMTARELARAGDYFGIAPSTVRVALTRAVATGELERDGSTYQLGERLLARRRRQDEHAAVVAWDRTWEMAVVVTSGRPSGERAALRTELTAARLAELREGVWMRPANLSRTLPHADASALRTFRATPEQDPAALAAGLWDLGSWADEAAGAIDLLGSTTEPAERLAVAAHLVRHLAADPLLPPELWPDGWPAPQARAAYAGYQQELRALGAW
ncbi:PaaX family transcriptional regulator C-terminal domain-containing protein [Nocardioides sp.]|uniref:PaaX family transcriptional regulator C-terminal domain-containing protein n=1 Tax=Nocardioides sp. TaxID=35761 RepID=UPI0031FEAEF4|nr:PaaX protein C-domain protein [Nocardioides sp.]